MVNIIRKIIKPLIFIFRKRHNKIKNAFCGPAIMKQVFHLEKLKTYGCHI